GQHAPADPAEGDVLVRRALLVGVLAAVALVAPRAQGLPAWTSHSTLVQLLEGLEAGVAGANTAAFVPLSAQEQRDFGVGVLQMLAGDPLAGRDTLRHLGL